MKSALRATWMIPAVLAALSLMAAPPLLAQSAPETVDVLDFGLPDTGNPAGVANDTATIGMDQPPEPEPEPADPFAIRNAVREELKAASESGLMVPQDIDVENYTVESLTELKGILDNQSDPCLKAVEAALFLDARHPPDFLTYAGKLTVEGLPKELAKIWIIPDEYNATNLLTKGFAKTVIGAFDVANKTLLSYEAFVDAHLRAVIDRRASWTQEMVHQAIRADYDGELLEHARGRLDLIVSKNADLIEQSDATYADELAKAEQAYATAIGDAKGRQRYDLAEHEKKWGRLWQDNNAAIIEYNRAINRYKKAESDAVRARYSVLEAAEAKRQRALAAAMEHIAEARVKREALDRYVAPISRGTCEEITAPANAALPLDAVKTAVVDQIKQLDQQKFDSLISELGAEVPGDFYGCLCARNANGGVGGGWTIDGGKCYSVGVLGGKGEVDMSGPGTKASWEGCLDKLQVPAADGSEGTPILDLLVDRLRQEPGRAIETAGQ